MDAVLSKSTYKMPSPNWDHDHCVFCFDKFSERPDDLSEGYHTADRKYWICPECFDDFREMFHFTVK